MIGKRTFHIRGGWCVIKRAVRTGVRVRVIVDFDYGARDREIPFEELREGPDGKPLQVPHEWSAAPNPAPVKVEPNGKPTWQESRQFILALRLGQVTEELVTRLSVGTEEVEAACEFVLNSASERKPAFLVVEGPWGTGKTHALALFNAMARKRRFASATVVLDGISVTLGRPQDLLKAIVHEVNFPQNPGVYSFSERIAEFVREGRVGILEANGARLLAAALDAIPRQLASDPDAWETVENYLAGEVSATVCAQTLRQYYERPLRIQSLATRFRAERPERAAQLIYEWANACRVMPAEGIAHGLALLFDEADVELDLGGRTKVESEQRELFLKALGALNSREAPLCAVFAVAPGTSLPGLWSPTDYLATHLGHNVKVVSVPRLTPQSMLQVAEFITKLYGEAYPENTMAPDVLWRPFAEQKIREMHRSTSGIIPRVFIRLFLEFLDIQALKPNGQH